MGAEATKNAGGGQRQVMDRKKKSATWLVRKERKNYFQHLLKNALPTFQLFGKVTLEEVITFSA